MECCGGNVAEFGSDIEPLEDGPGNERPDAEGETDAAFCGLSPAPHPLTRICLLRASLRENDLSQ